MKARHFILAAMAGFGVSFASMATAADYLGGAEPAGTGDGSHDWSGVYVGLQAGMQSPGGFKPFSERRGWTVGGQGGINFQAGPLVYGGEVEGNISSGTHFRHGGGAEHEQRSTVAAKARAGVAFDRTLVYGTAGYGLTKLKSRGTITSDDQWEGGFLYGAGLEQAIAGGTSVRAEYTIHHLEDVGSTMPGGLHRSDDLSSHHLRFGVNRRF